MPVLRKPFLPAPCPASQAGSTAAAPDRAPQPFLSSAPAVGMAAIGQLTCPGLCLSQPWGPSAAAGGHLGSRPLALYFLEPSLTHILFALKSQSASLNWLSQSCTLTPHVLSPLSHPGAASLRLPPLVGLSVTVTLLPWATSSPSLPSTPLPGHLSSPCLQLSSLNLPSHRGLTPLKRLAPLPSTLSHTAPGCPGLEQSHRPSFPLLRAKCSRTLAHAPATFALLT